MFSIYPTSIYPLSQNPISPPQVPGGLLPVLEIDGRVVTESSVIMALLEEEFPEHRPLMPVKGTQERARADGLMRLEREWRHGRGGQGRAGLGDTAGATAGAGVGERAGWAGRCVTWAGKDVLMGYNEKTSAALSSPFLPPPPSGQLFSDWLGWLCNDWDGRGKQARFEATMDLVARELSAAGVSDALRVKEADEEAGCVL